MKFENMSFRVPHFGTVGCWQWWSLWGTKGYCYRSRRCNPHSLYPWSLGVHW